MWYQPTFTKFTIEGIIRIFRLFVRLHAIEEIICNVAHCQNRNRFDCVFFFIIIFNIGYFINSTELNVTA